MTLSKHGEDDIIQGRDITIDIMTTQLKFCSWGRVGSALSTSAGKWEFLAKEQGKGGFWLNQLNRILAERRQGWPAITWGMLEDEEPSQIARLIRYGGWEFWLNWFIRFLLKLDNAEGNMKGRRCHWKVQGGLSRVWSRRKSLSKWIKYIITLSLQTTL